MAPATCPPNNSSSTHHHRLNAILTLATLLSAAIWIVVVEDQYQIEKHDHVRKVLATSANRPPLRLSIRDHNQRRAQELKTQLTHCAPMPTHNGTLNLPIWVPGYPGSGSELFVELVAALTGMPAGNVYAPQPLKGCQNHQVTCKTHWPWYKSSGHHNDGGFDPSSEYHRFHSHYLLLIRNPRDAMPSYYNYLYEQRHEIAPHTVQAPEDRWNLYRQKHLAPELQSWQDMLLSWHYNTTYELGAIVPYEHLMHDNVRLLPLLRRIASVLRSAHVPVAPNAELYCHWRRVVLEHPRVKRSGGPRYAPGYTGLEQQMMLAAVQEAQWTFADDNDKLVALLQLYYDDIASNTRIIAEDGAVPSTAVE